MRSRYLTVGAMPVANLKIQLVVDNIFGKQAPYPFPAVPPNSQFSGLDTGLSANYKFNPF